MRYISDLLYLKDKSDLYTYVKIETSYSSLVSVYRAYCLEFVGLLCPKLQRQCMVILQICHGG